MSSRLKFALVLGLVSTTALSSYASTNPYSMPTKASSGSHASEIHKGRMELKSSHAKLSQVEHGWPVVPLPMSKYFVPFKAKKVLISFDNELENMSVIGQDAVGQMITEEKLLAINTQITDYYLAHDYLLPQITIDKDAMLSGILKLDVKAGCISNVVVMGDGEQNSLIKEYADKIANQKPAMKHYTQKYLGLMNKVPGFEVSYQLVPNAEKSTKDNKMVDLIVYTTKKKASLFAGVDNFSPNSLGKYNFSLLGEAYTPFASGDSLVLNGSTTNHPRRLSDVGGGYNMILNSLGTTGHIYAAHAEDNSTRAQQVVTPNGQSNSFRVALSQQLVLRANKDLELELGYDYRTSTQYEVNPATGLSQKYTVQKYSSGDIGLRFLSKDSLNGRNLVHTKVTQGFGGTFRNYIDNPATLPKQKFTKLALDIYRDQHIVDNVSLFIHLAATHSKDNLPTAEQSTIGGREFGRGYAFGTLEGTKMQAGSLELRYTKELGKYFVDEIQPYIYGDTGHMNKYYANTNTSHLESFGGGLRFKFAKQVDLGMEVAQPCKKHVIVDGTAIKSDTVFNVFINKVFEF